MSFICKYFPSLSEQKIIQMKDIVLISIPETTISDIVEKAVKKVLSEHEAVLQVQANQKTIFAN